MSRSSGECGSLISLMTSRVGRYEYFVSGRFGERIEVVVRVESQGKIVRTHPDAGDDLLVHLPRC